MCGAALLGVVPYRIVDGAIRFSPLVARFPSVCFCNAIVSNYVCSCGCCRLRLLFVVCCFARRLSHAQVGSWPPSFAICSWSWSCHQMADTLYRCCRAFSLLGLSPAAPPAPAPAQPPAQPLSDPAGLSGKAQAKRCRAGLRARGVLGNGVRFQVG